MARTRLIIVAAERLLGAVSSTGDAVMQIAGHWSTIGTLRELLESGRLFFEEPDHVDPKMIQVRYALHGEGLHLGRIMVDRGNVDAVLAELRKGPIL